MKPKKSLFKRSIIAITIVLFAIANLFTIGFSSFIIYSNTTINGNDISVQVSEIAFINIDKNNANSPEKNGFASFQCSYHGFTETGSAQPTSKIQLFFDLNINSRTSINLGFTLKQITSDPAYDDFDLTSCMNKMTLNATVNTNLKSKTLAIENVDRAKRMVTKTFNTDDVNVLFNHGVIVPMSIEILIDTTGKDFARDVFLPLYKSKTRYELEIKVNG